MKQQKKPVIVGLGGTFDHLHKGHQDFLRFASRQGTELAIGVAHASMTRQKSFAESVQPYHTRAMAVKNFCKRSGIKATVTQLTDIYGPTLQQDAPGIVKLAVTSETIVGAQKINEARAAMGLFELPVHVCALTKDELGNDLHSEAIRAGRVNRNGFSYSQLFTQDRIVSDIQKEYLRRPLGPLVGIADLVADLEGAEFPIVLVGDVTTQFFLDNNLPFDLALYDGLSQRQPISTSLHSFEPALKVANAAGTITAELAQKIQSFFLNTSTQEDRVLFKVSGEEDLAMPVVNLLAPLNTRIYYGQPHEGIVQVVVTEQNKEKLCQLFS
jgi:cytidyltransferase-like protein